MSAEPAEQSGSLAETIRQRLAAVAAQSPQCVQGAKAAADHIQALDVPLRAAAVVGSTARGWFQTGSDLDILCFDQSCDASAQTSVDGWSINLIAVSLQETQSFLASEEADLTQLRLASNLEFCIPILGADTLAPLREINRRLRLSSHVENEYRRLARAAFDAVARSQAVESLVWTTNMALQATILLVLAASPIRAIKPKWTMRSLALIDPGLSDLVRGLLGNDAMGAYVAPAISALLADPTSLSGEATTASIARQRSDAMSWDQDHGTRSFLDLCLAARLADRLPPRRDIAQLRGKALEGLEAFFQRAQAVLEDLQPSGK